MTDNPPIKIYVNEPENKFTFRIKKEYYLELLTSERIKLPGSFRSKISKDKSGENVPQKLLK